MIKQRQKLRNDMAEIEGILSTGAGLFSKSTGYGKNYSVFKYSTRYKHVRFIYPNKPMKNDMNDKYRKEIESTDFKFISYSKLRGLYKKKQMENEFISCNNSDTLFICDECHMACATVTFKAISFLKKICPNAHYLGLSGTAKRSDGKNPASLIFNNTVSTEYSISDGIRDGIFQKPHYIIGTFELDEEIKKYQEAIDNVDSPDISRFSLNKSIVELGRLNTAEIIHRYTLELLGYRNYYKYLMYFPTKACLEQKATYYENAFKEKFPEHTINVLKIYSGCVYAKNVDKLNTLYDNGEKKIDVIMTVDMLNMSYHTDNLSAVIMVRPTRSDIVYKQQFGRAFQAYSKNTPIVFDFVGNWALSTQVQSIRTESRYSRNNLELASDEIEVGDIYLHDMTMDVVHIKRAIDTITVNWFPAIIDAYLHKNAPISYCCGKLGITEEEFLSIIDKFTNKEKDES